MSAPEISTDKRCDIAAIWDFHNPSKMEAEVRAQLAGLGQHASESSRAQLLTQLARSLGLQRKFAQAHQVLDEADSLINDEKSLARVRSLLERGRVFYFACQPDRSRLLFLDAWDLANALGQDYYAVDAAHMLGIAEPVESALQWNQTALRLAEQSKLEGVNVWAGCLYNNMGWIYFDEADYNMALTMFERSRKHYQALKGRQEIETAEENIQQTLRAMGRSMNPSSRL